MRIRRRVRTCITRAALSYQLSVKTLFTCHAERSSEDREAIVTAETKHPYSHCGRVRLRFFIIGWSVPRVGMLRLRTTIASR
jgi:hypothetical protein